MRLSKGLYRIVVEAAIVIGYGTPIVTSDQIRDNAYRGFVHLGPNKYRLGGDVVAHAICDKEACRHDIAEDNAMFYIILFLKDLYGLDMEDPSSILLTYTVAVAESLKP